MEEEIENDNSKVSILLELQIIKFVENKGSFNSIAAENPLDYKELVFKTVCRSNLRKLAKSLMGSNLKMTIELKFLELEGLDQPCQASGKHLGRLTLIYF